MVRAQSRSWLFLVALLTLMATRPAVAISPAFLMFYGGPLEQLPTSSQPAVMLTTPTDMQQVSRPIPDQLEGFRAGWTLTTADLSNAEILGVPGFN